MTREVMDGRDVSADDRFEVNMAGYLTTGLMLIVAAIHLAPITGFFGTRPLHALYGIEVESPDLEILMRHRAMLFGILGAFFAYAAFVPELQPVAFVAATASLASFFYLAVAVGNYRAPIRKVVIADVVAAVCLAGAVLSHAVDRAG